MIHNLGLAGVALAVIASVGEGQAPAGLLDRAVRAYVDLDYEGASALFRSALSSSDSMADTQRAFVFGYLGASEFFRGHTEAARDAFERALAADPRFAPDTLVFPPAVVNLFRVVWSETMAVPVTVQPATSPLDSTNPVNTRLHSTSFRPAVGVSAGGINVRTQTTIGSRRTTWQSLGLVATGRLSMGRVSLEGNYLQTSAAPVPNASAQTMVEAEAHAGFQLLPWLALKSGARARAFVLPAGTRRWLLWELRTRLGGPLGVTWARGAVDVWTSLAGVTNVAERLESGRGGEAAFAARMPLLPAWLRVAYRIDAIRSSVGSRREVTQGLSLSVAVGHGAP